MSEGELRDLFADPNSCQNLASSTGSMFSYISYCSNGKADKKFGLTELDGDYKVVLKIYDGNVCVRNPEKYWIDKTQEMYVTLNRHDPLWKDIKELFPKAAATLQRKGAALKKSAKSHPLY
ncbi:hypothetical protein AVEN_239900-1 [Araneus ventricosus]|uniref:Uncharacterized protein n=1 Tax=Araneus ventricosus TaxID=182803 RepID=A0A4Y2S8C9_ARAVE|nr:hypothetical protein AVEN_239900-1 [Araneus ventricosus]